jgi:hypothetical protein
MRDDGFQMHRIRLSGLVEISFLHSRALHFQLHQSPLYYNPCITPRQRNYATRCDWLPKSTTTYIYFLHRSITTVTTGLKPYPFPPLLL